MFSTFFTVRYHPPAKLVSWHTVFQIYSTPVRLAKKIIFSLFTLFLVFRTVELLRHVSYSRPIDFNLGESLLVAFLLCLFITGIFAFPGFVFPTSRVMPDRYWKATNPKRLNYFFDLLGVETFKSIMVILFWGKPKHQKRYYDGTREGLQNFLYQTQQSEFGHLGAWIVISLVSVFLLVRQYFLISSVLMLLNLIANLYPVILQRHHRIRIYALLERLPKPDVRKD